MELSQTYCDVDLDQYDIDLTWLKSVPKTFSCEKCTKSYKRRSNLKRHEKNCSGENRSFRWNWMTSMFKQFSSNDSSHHSALEEQKEEKPFKCNVCQRTFKRIEHLDRHKKIHTCEKSFVCKICQKAFARSDHLKRHEKNCSGENRSFRWNWMTHTQPFMCDICCGRFTRKDQLLKHKLIHQIA